MRLSRVVFLSALAMVTGCGGCDSCFGTAQPGDDAALAVTATAPLATTPDAARAAVVESDDAGDAGDAARPPVDAGPLPQPSSLPRPKAPMGLGAYQVCGRYDAPLCTKDCPAGNCRQECDGVGCVLTCQGGYCSQLCGATGKCKLTCVGGHCVQACTTGEDCIKECSGGSCE